ncbi:MAG: type III secretion system outer membrane ring subunit SctC [Kiritimatiellae bacterium]|nr:type III secretion system outer membrane ring subunit SctC [Kiritimatiellia bacterium]
MRGVFGVIAALFAFAVVTPSATAAEVPWKTATYTLVARDMELRTAIDTFAVSQGLSVVMSESVSGVFSGDFRDVPCQEFLERLATVHNLTYYYDGAALYLYGAGEVQTLLLELQYMKAGEVRQMLAELGVEDARFPLRTASNDELIMVSGPPRYVAIVAEMIAKADKLREMRTFNEVEVRMYPLRHTWADDVSFSVSSPESTMTIKGVAHMLEEMMSNDTGMNIAQATPASGGEQGEGAKETQERPQTSFFKPVIRPENRLNAVVVRDVKSRLPMYDDLVRQLDVPQKLVEIDVTVVELSKKDALDWQLSLGLTTSHGHSDYGTGQNADNLMSPDGIIGKGLAGAMTHIHSSYALSASLSALKQKGKARSISRTTLLTVNNLAAQIIDTQSYHARVVGTEVASLEEVTAGTRLTIKPRIITSPATNVPNQVWLTMDLDDGGFESISVDSMPMTRTSRLLTQTAIFEDESILLAGYLRDIEENAGWGIPWLRDIPFIGWLFGGSSTRRETVQRMFVMTPRVVDLDAEMLARLQSTRLRDISEIEPLEDDAEKSDEAREQRTREREREKRMRRETRAVERLEREEEQRRKYEAFEKGLEERREAVRQRAKEREQAEERERAEAMERVKVSEVQVEVEI